MKFSFSTDKIERALDNVSSGLKKLKGLSKSVQQKMLPAVASDIKAMRRLAKEIEKADTVFFQKEFDARVKSFEKLIDLSESVKKGITKIEDSDAPVPKVSNDRSKKKVTVSGSQKLGGLKGVADKLTALKKEADTTKQQAETDKTTLIAAWKNAKKLGDLHMKIDPKITDILEATSKKLAINMPPKQLFVASVKFKGVPKEAEEQFKKDALPVLQKKAVEQLKGVKEHIAKQLQLYSNDFDSADKNGDVKAAETAFNNVNQLIGKDVPLKLDTAIQKAAAATIDDVRKAHTSEYINGLKDAAVDKVEVNTSSFFSVEVVPDKSNPADKATKTFLEVMDKGSKIQSNYDSLVKEVAGSWKSLESALGDLEYDLQKLVEKSEGGSGSLGKTLRQVQKPITSISEVAVDLDKERKALFKIVRNAADKFRSAARNFQDNRKVDKQQVVKLDKSIKTLDGALTDRKKTVDSISVRLTAYRKLSDDVKKLDTDFNDKMAENVLGRIPGLGKDAKGFAKDAEKELAFEEEFSDVKEAANKLTG